MITATGIIARPNHGLVRSLAIKPRAFGTLLRGLGA